MTARIITNEGAREVSDREFFASIFGHPPRTPEQRQAEWDARVEHYIERILSGCDFSSYGNPAVAEAMKRIAERERADLEPKKRPDGRWEIAA